MCNTLLFGERLGSGLGGEQANETQDCLAITVYLTKTNFRKAIPTMNTHRITICTFLNILLITSNSLNPLPLPIPRHTLRKPQQTAKVMKTVERPFWIKFKL